MTCIECGGQLEQTDSRSWDCLDCGAELYRGDDGEIAVCGYHDVDDNDDEDDGVPKCAGGCGGYPDSCRGCNLGGNR